MTEFGNVCVDHYIDNGGGNDDTILRYNNSWRAETLEVGLR